MTPGLGERAQGRADVSRSTFLHKLTKVRVLGPAPMLLTHPLGSRDTLLNESHAKPPRVPKAPSLDVQAPAAFVPGSKEDAADAVATYTAAMRARSAAAAIGRTSPLRPKVRIAQAHLRLVWPSDALCTAGWQRPTIHATTFLRCEITGTEP